MANPKLERLMNLTAALLNTRVPLTAEQLRERVEGYPPDDQSFKRAFERDKEDLREMGIPIRIEEIPGSLPHADGYRIRPSEYYLRDPGLTPDELAALHLATAAVQIDGVQGLGGLWKLGGTPASVADVVPGPVAELASDPNLVVLFSALGERRVVRIVYGGLARDVEPHRLQFQRGRWYLVAHDRTRSARRVFRLDRIEGAVTSASGAEAFVRPDDAATELQLEPWLAGDDDAVTAHVLLDGAIAPAVLQELGEHTVLEEREGGAVVVALPVTNRQALRTFVLGLGDRAEVLAPEELRADLVAWLEELAR